MVTGGTIKSNNRQLHATRELPISVSDSKLVIGFIGNFSVPYSTENERKKAFEKLGHIVMPFQENQTTPEQLLAASTELDLLMYSHTHDPAYNIRNLISVFKTYKKLNIPTASAHLDRWAGLARVRDVGREATWFTEYIFMADGSPEAVKLYEKHNLNWYWLKPGVAEDACYIARPDHKKFPHEIVFTGSRRYHAEYPFRPELIDFLHKEYGDRFGHYGNDGIRVVREDDLNQLYASAKIVVGDSCFGGRPHYVSDRYYEVRGRGGFLVHPHQKDIDITGVGDYEQGNLAVLKKVIDHWLRNEESREIMRTEGFNWVKENATYTHRAKEMLDIIFGDTE